MWFSGYVVHWPRRLQLSASKGPGQIHDQAVLPGIRLGPDLELVAELGPARAVDPDGVPAARLGVSALDGHDHRPFARVAVTLAAVQSAQTELKGSTSGR